MAQNHNKTPAQIILRWLIQKDIIVDPKSATPE
jgi:diketogulonate reductase-like aldo/keto reductase